MIYLMMIDAEEDKQKFAILYETYRHLMMKVALNVLKDTFLAEDAVHEAFIKIAKNMEKIGEIDATATKRYLLTITKNATIDITGSETINFNGKSMWMSWKNVMSR